MSTDPSANRAALALSDGRRLAYSVSGPADGSPVLYCHGAIGTALGAALDLETLTGSLGVRLIAPSRPGVGGSDACDGRTILDFAQDVRELADALALPAFSVVGVSAGGPYALAVAHALPGRVRRVSVCSSLSPLCAPHRAPGLSLRVRLALTALARAPRLCAALGDTALPVIDRHPYVVSRVIQAHAAPAERRLLGKREERDAASLGFLEAARGGVRGMVDDFLTYSGPWGFAAGEVTAEVQLWHGLCDPLVPLEHALALASALPRCRLFLDPDEGHHFFRSHLSQILAMLVGRTPGRHASQGRAQEYRRAV
jgi:pimeloyl-ACP methyl ester carboxylesterase